MPRMTQAEARALCSVFGIDPAQDWHAMPSAMKEAVLKAADSRNYRKPAAANGSRGRYFAAYLARLINQKDSSV